MIVFFHLLLMNSKLGVADHAAISKTLISFAHSHETTLQLADQEKQLENTPQIKFPNERRKYGLNETAVAFINFDEAPLVFIVTDHLFTKEHQQHIHSSSVSLSLLRAPPAA